MRNIAIANLLNPSIEDVKKYLQEAGKDYAAVLGKLPQDKDPKSFIAAHYWNVMDYKSKIGYAKGFYRKRSINNFNEPIFERQSWDFGF